MENENQEQKKLGLRIKSARVLTGLNQEEFARQCGFNHTSLRNWEFGRVYPRAEALERLIDAFKNLGVFTCLEWIVAGLGEGPMLTENEASTKKELSSDAVVSAYKKSLEKLDVKAIVVTVSNDHMQPFFYAGDIVGGRLVNIKRANDWSKQRRQIFMSSPVLAKYCENEFQPCWLHSDDEDKWWARTQCDLSLKPLNSSLIGIIALRLQRAEPVFEQDSIE